jgi:hypothetical protein
VTSITKSRSIHVIVKGGAKLPPLPTTSSAPDRQD